MIDKLFQRNILAALCANIENKTYSNSFFINGEYFTYRNLGENISKIRKELTSVEGKIVGLAIHDDIETYASIFALWMEGKAYVPLHPNQPIERNIGIVGQVGLDCIIDSKEDSVYGQWTSGNGNKLICSSKLVYSGDFLDNWAEVDDNELAYLLFTSGSTGTPKGVMLSRKNLASFVDAFFDVYSLDSSDRCLQCFDLTFDLSIMSYLMPLLRGACVFTVPYDGVKYFQIGALIENFKLTFALMAPSTIKLLRPYFDEINCSSLKYSLFCGEALPLDVTEEWSKCACNAVIDNVYGPTEDTIFCSIYRFSRDSENKTHNGVLSIGGPMKNCGMAVFDDSLNVCESGEMGELCLCGNQLSVGYYNNEIKNNEAFFVKDGIRWYKTGDVCYVDDDGYYMYSGRLDQQAKIQGYRVELGEIEFHAKNYLKDKNAICLTAENEKGITEIVLFIESKKFDVSELLVFLRSKMPAYMIPSRVLFEEHFPLNKSEKIDRVALKQMIV